MIYIMPRPVVDSMLPLEIDPAPTSVARVFVGRVEMLSPWMRQRIETAAAGGDVPALLKLGRFLQPFAAQIQRTTSLPSLPIQEAAGRLLKQEFDGPTCVQ